MKLYCRATRVLQGTIPLVFFIIVALLPLARAEAVSAAPVAPPALALSGPESVPATAATIDVVVNVSGAVDLAAFEADLGYDPALVEVTGITAGGFLGETSPGCDPYAARCEAVLGPLPQGADRAAIGGYAFGTGEPAGGSGTLATVHLAPTGATGVLTLTLSGAIAADAAATPITPTVQGTVIRIVGEGHEVYLPLILKGSE